MPIPFGVREVIRQRLALLDEATLEALDVAAVMGVAADEPTLRAAMFVLTEKDGADVEGAIGAARRAGILDPATGGGAISFSHALTRDALYRTSAHEADRDPRCRRRGAREARRIAPASRRVRAPRDRGGRGRRPARRARGRGPLTRLRRRGTAWPSSSRGARRTRGEQDERGAADLRLLLRHTRMRLGEMHRRAAGRARSASRRLRAQSRTTRSSRAPRSPMAPSSRRGTPDPTMRSLLEETLERLEGHASAGMESPEAAGPLCAPASRPVSNRRRIPRRSLNEPRRRGGGARARRRRHAPGGPAKRGGDSRRSVLRTRRAKELNSDAVRIATSLGDRAALLRARLRLIFAADRGGRRGRGGRPHRRFRVGGEGHRPFPAGVARESPSCARCARCKRGAGPIATRWWKRRPTSSSAPRTRSAPYALMLHRWALAMETERSVVGFEPALLAMVSRWNDPETYSRRGHRGGARLRRRCECGARAPRARLPRLDRRTESASRLGT